MAVGVKANLDARVLARAWRPSFPWKPHENATPRLVLFPRRARKVEGSLRRRPGPVDSLTQTGLQSYLLRRWDWGGCQEGPVIPY